MVAERLVRLALGFGLSALVAGCLERRAEDQATNAEQNQCTACHGSSARAGTPLQQSAPPNDLNGNTETSAPGVGSHQIHLVATDAHRAVECAECHVVPRTVDERGHMEGRGPAQFVPGPTARLGGRTPSYDAAARTCSDVYCHLDGKPVWTAPRADACGTCHGIPPADPHPQSKQCYTCHSETVDQDNKLKDLSKHIDGKVEVALECNSCHGSAASDAPPKDVAGNTEPSSPGVGAHQKHLAGGAKGRPVACTECHVVPEKVGDPGHLDETAGAEVVFTGVAGAHQRVPSYDRTSRRCADSWCHAPQPDKKPAESPRWTGEDGDATCTTCHGKPPPPPHVQMSNCAFCHGEVAGEADGSIKARALHVDGTVQVVMPTKCNACHGSAGSDAPPTTIAGETETTARGVGAHQKHLTGGGLFYRRIECGDCHVVPATVEAPGHFDTALPAELAFAGVASAGAAKPTWDGVRCANTYCHATVVEAGADMKGAVPAPEWTKVDGSQVYCGSCHGIPPIETDPQKPQTKHPVAYECPECHKNLSTGFIFKDPSLHVNGKVDMTVGVDL